MYHNEDLIPEQPLRSPCIQMVTVQLLGLAEHLLGRALHYDAAPAHDQHAVSLGGFLHIVVMDTMVMPAARSWSMVFMTWARPWGSSMAVDSSSTRQSGRMAITPAMATRCFWPPLNLYGAASRFS